ncbi:MAG: aminotransferase class I/II-fold pyridoxal phosphate-dependent enzyme, partial [Pseudomonas sp.]|nr:aminotransferase class I/II-fold pyridoxal phosphate-dependent enzyme [Pseudomonas sp.]
MHFHLDRDLPIPLVQQLTEHLQAWIEQQRLRPGARLPSIRALAKAQAVSASCVIEAYDRLAANGWLQARHGAGFFVAERKPGLRPDPGESWGEAIDGSWRQFREGHEQLLKLGCGWLPVAWRAEAELAQAIRQVSRGAPEALFDYCPPQGLASLRLQLHKGLARLDIAAEPERIVTTQGASHALDLLVRTLLNPGDTVLVERPGYYNLYNLLRLHGVHMLEVPRTATGPDLVVWLSYASREMSGKILGIWF